MTCRGRRGATGPTGASAGVGAEEDSPQLFFSGIARGADAFYLADSVGSNDSASFVPIDYPVTVDIVLTELAFNVSLNFFSGPIDPGDTLQVQLRKNGAVVVGALVSWAPPVAGDTLRVTFASVAFSAVGGDTLGVEVRTALADGVILVVAGTLG